LKPFRKSTPLHPEISVPLSEWVASKHLWQDRRYYGYATLSLLGIYLTVEKNREEEPNLASTEPCAVYRCKFQEEVTTKSDGGCNIEHLLTEVIGIRGVLLFHLIVLCSNNDGG
jgi:hypothetical protein